MDRLYATNNAYNNSLAIIQSSGNGKSRLVDAAAQLRFAFPMNLRETLAHGDHGLSSCHDIEE